MRWPCTGGGSTSTTGACGRPIPRRVRSCRSSPPERPGTNPLHPRAETCAASRLTGRGPRRTGRPAGGAGRRAASDATARHCPGSTTWGAADAVRRMRPARAERNSTVRPDKRSGRGSQPVRCAGSSRRAESWDTSGARAGTSRSTTRTPASTTPSARLHRRAVQPAAGTSAASMPRAAVNASKMFEAMSPAGSHGHYRGHSAHRFGGDPASRMESPRLPGGHRGARRGFNGPRCRRGLGRPRAPVRGRRDRRRTGRTCIGPGSSRSSPGDSPRPDKTPSTARRG